MYAFLSLVSAVEHRRRHCDHVFIQEPVVTRDTYKTSKVQSVEAV